MAVWVRFPSWVRCCFIRQQLLASNENLGLFSSFIPFALPAIFCHNKVNPVNGSDPEVIIFNDDCILKGIIKTESFQFDHNIKGYQM